MMNFEKWNDKIIKKGDTRVQEWILYFFISSLICLSFLYLLIFNKHLRIEHNNSQQEIVTEYIYVPYTNSIIEKETTVLNRGTNNIIVEPVFKNNGVSRLMVTNIINIFTTCDELDVEKHIKITNQK